MSRSLRLNDVTFSSGRIRCRVIALDRVNSRSPSGPWMRPNPDSPTPPYGSAGTCTNPSAELTEVIPVRKDRAAASPAERSLVNTADPSPYRLALANETASARLTTDVTVTVGPNVSCVTAMLCSGTSVRITGGRYEASFHRSGGVKPGTDRRPPRASASATCLATISPCAGDVIGP